MTALQKSRDRRLMRSRKAKGLRLAHADEIERQAIEARAVAASELQRAAILDRVVHIIRVSEQAKGRAH